MAAVAFFTAVVGCRCACDVSSASAATCENTSAALLVVSSRGYCVLCVWCVAALGRVKQKKFLLLIESNGVWRLQVHCSPAKGKWAVVSDGAPEVPGA